MTKEKKTLPKCWDYTYARCRNGMILLSYVDTSSQQKVRDNFYEKQKEANRGILR